MADIGDLNITDASNTARFPENMAPSAVNDGARALEGIIARWYADTNGSLVSTGSANAYVLAANQTLSAYAQGQLFVFEANFGNTGAATLNVDAIGAKAIKKHNDVALASGDIESGQIVVVAYEAAADAFQLLSPLANESLTSGAIGVTVQGYDAGISTTPLTQGLHTINLVAGTWTPTETGGCASIASYETTAGRPMIRALAFGPSADEHAQVAFSFPKGWDEGTVTFRVKYSTLATDTDGVAWGLQAVAVSDGDTMDVAFGTPVVVTDDAQGAAEDL